jgi:ABC-type transport system involved in cytochrome c biogenesis ATPase subunit
LNSLFNSNFVSIKSYDTNLIRYNIPSNIHLLDKHADIVIEKNMPATYPLPELAFSRLFLNSFESSYAINNGFITQTADAVYSLLSDCLKGCLSHTHILTYMQQISSIEDIRVAPPRIYKTDDKISVELIIFEFKINESWFPWSHLSDGTRRLFYVISEICCQDEGLILIEEPELGIHPHQLYKLMQFIKEQSEEKQIIIATHSPLILDTLASNELDRIIVAKAENGGSKFHKLSEEQISASRKYMSEVGELSYYWLHSDLEEND